jgi:hypothetical protein
MPIADKILVLTARHEPFERGPYVVHALIEEWRNRGISVEVTDHLAEPTGPEVLVFPHFNLTTTPASYRHVLDRCDRVVNRSVNDISKRAISTKLVKSPADYDGPVIVKTNRNYGGLPEARATARQGGLQRSFVWLTRRLPSSISGLVGHEGYRVYNHPRLVPRIVWLNPLFVVEKFLPEREREFYCLRQYVFLGESEFSSRTVSPDPIVKSENVIRRDLLEDTPSAVREFRKRLGFDYGKFDYVMRGDEAIVFDVNRTPTYNPSSKAGSASPLILSLASGIEPFLGGA